ncbi:MAG: hypothetical protein ACRD4C_01915 [Candidatus Acidiferrales bacterium]
MRFRASHLIATLALTICLVCPLLEVFDSWDHTLQTGIDNEYTLVILALTVGVAYSFASAARLACSRPGIARVVNLLVRKYFASTNSIPETFIPISPPCLELRI